MNFTTLVSEVVAKVKRPDKAGLARVQVNAAMQYFSQEHDYERDLVEVVWPLVAAPATNEFIISTSSLTRFRKIDYIKLVGTLHYINELESRKLSKTCEFMDKWYLAGGSVNVKSSKDAAGLDVSYYSYPPYLTDDTVGYWMLQGNWMAILERASSFVFNDIGDPEAASMALRASNEYASIFKSDTIRGSTHG